MMQLTFENTVLDVRENKEHEWILETSLVAAGYGVEESSLRSTKSRNEDELREGKHYLLLQIATSGQSRSQTFWTKRGVIRLGFFIKSDRAKRFRDWAEDLIIGSLKKTTNLPDFSNPVIAARAWADEVEAKMLAEARADELAAENYQLGLITEHQEAEIKKVAPKAKHYDKVMKADGVLTVSQIAVDLGFRKAADLNSYLKRKKVIKKVNDAWVLTAEYTGNHYTKPVAHTYQGSGGVEKTKEHTYWTQRGKEFLMEFIRLNPEGQKKIVKPMLYHQLTI